MECFSWFAKKALNISFAFCLPGAPSEFQADVCPHELGHPIYISALPCCCGWDKQKEETIHVKKGKIQYWEEMAEGWSRHLLHCKVVSATSEGWVRTSASASWLGEACTVVLTPSYLAKLSMHQTVHEIQDQDCTVAWLLLLRMSNALRKSLDVPGLVVTTVDAIFNIISKFQTDINRKIS